MQHLNNGSERTFGYLTTVESPEYGFFGGYLIVSLLGRPLEFHCTAPVRPSRAQEILYGPTLQPYLLGEQICGALLGKAKLSPAVILTDRSAILQARSRASVPLVLVAHRAAAPISNELQLADDEVQELYDFNSAPGFEPELDAVLETLSQLARHVELMEPFGRIHEAIREAQRIGGRGTNANDQAA